MMMLFKVSSGKPSEGSSRQSTKWNGVFTGQNNDDLINSFRDKSALSLLPDSIGQ